jgi:leucyl/phenylalanyl-tRNA---protein transferase
LDHRLIFPPHEKADREGILAVGGDLSLERLLLAYSNGIFPWYSEEEPIIWWSPPERFVLFFDEIHLGRTLKKFLKKHPYRCSFNEDFRSVIKACRKAREKEGTWITQEMEEAYGNLHEAGFAHSVEVWQEDVLVGGLYGVAMGKYFCGESMFHLAENTSKLALWELCKKLKEMGFTFIDCQMHTPHLEALGARNISREAFLKLLKDAIAA